MKAYENFTHDDLMLFLDEYLLMVQDKRSTDFNQCIPNYKKLAEIWGCSVGHARAILAKETQLKKHHYLLLAVHSGNIQPALKIKKTDLQNIFEDDEMKMALCTTFLCQHLPINQN
ncbi:hypothetical protein [uncultured Tolumonas sp.]|uniref:hypothetical protein n=1 Tax=uncultured Tolumonas sp. TaxID=263765 RepID=UPI002A0A5A0D|nr:hypothetical protein [uncultured Tolumonas sp.]